jgi:hypothetical protein
MDIFPVLSVSCLLVMIILYAVEMKMVSKIMKLCVSPYSDDNIDMNIEDMMVMEAIWRSIQVSSFLTGPYMRLLIICIWHTVDNIIKADLLGQVMVCK